VKELTVADLHERIVDLERQFGAAISQLEQATERAERLTQRALARLGGHFTIDETAIELRVSVRTVKSRIRNGDFTLEQIPSTKVFGIPAEQVFAWAPARTLRKAAQREKGAE
jgi:hypothetical protein